jgi:hypothetical protein
VSGKISGKAHKRSKALFSPGIFGIQLKWADHGLGFQEMRMPRNAVKKNQSTQRSEEHASAERSAPTSVQPEQTPVQPDEAHLTGAGSKEQLRLLKKNVEEGKAERHPDLPAGLHSTGSFTEENERKK